MHNPQGALARSHPWFHCSRSVNTGAHACSFFQAGRICYGWFRHDTGSTFWHLYPPLHSDIRGENPRYPIICYTGNLDVLTMSPVADSDGVRSWSCNSQSLPLPHKELLRPAIICNHIPWGSYHWRTEFGHNTRCGV